jgi:hypothetical protein
MLWLPFPTNAWVEIDSFTLSSFTEIHYQRDLNYLGPIAIRLQRMNKSGLNQDTPYVAVDNIRVSEPPPDWSFAAPIYDLNPDAGFYLSFDDYNQTNGAPPTWQHIGTTTQGGSQQGTNHLHKSGWVFPEVRMGRVTTGISIDPVLNNNIYVPNTNYCAYFRNSIGAKMESPVFTNGVGSLYFDMVPVTLLAVLPIINVYIATNIVDPMLPIPPSAWEEIDSLELSSFTVIRYRKELNYSGPIAIRLQRMNKSGLNQDTPYVAVDNLRVSEPPADVLMSQGLSPFNAYPSVNANMEVQLRIDNTPGPHITMTDMRTNVLLVSRWNYLGQVVTPWVTNKMEWVDPGDGLGNGELWQPENPIRAHPEAGNLEYYFVCYFYGAYYHSKDYTVYPAVTNTVFASESKSPRTYSAAGITTGASGASTPFVYSLRLFPSSHETVNTVLFVNGVPTPQVMSMTLVGTNRWQAKYDIVNHPGVTNLLWYFEATGAYTNDFQTTSEKSYWQNIGSSPIQNGGLPYGDNCEPTDASITNRPGSWFGVTTVPGESSYVLFTLDTGRTNYLAGRGEYQNFNAWNVGSEAANKFTDALDKYPKISYSQNFSTNWSASYFGGKSNWFGVGTFSNITSRQFGPALILGDVNWLAGAFQEVIERTAINGQVIDAETAAQRRNQGVRLLGGATGLGLGYYQGNRLPTNWRQGLGTISFKARLSRPIATDPRL